MSEAAVPGISSPEARPHAVKRNVLATWVAHAISLVVGFFLMPYVLGVLGEHQYGTWVFINSFVSYAGILYLGMGETISRFVAKYEAESRPDLVNEIASLVLAIYCGTGTLALAIAGGLCWFAPQFGGWQGQELLQVQLVILLLGLNVAVSLCGTVCGGILLGLRRFDLERTVTLIFDFVRFGLILVFLSDTWGLVAIAAIYLFVTICEQVCFAVLAFRIYPTLQFRPAFVKWSMLQECSGFSGMTLISNLASSLIATTDSLVIGFMLGTDAIVPYYIALRLTQFIRQPIEKIAHICMPTAGALAAGADSRRLLKFLTTALGVVLLLIGGMFIGAWFFGGDLVRTWMKTEYPQTHVILCILLAAQVAVLPGRIMRAFLFGAGYVRVPGLIYLLESIGILGAAIALCHWWGLVGVAWGTAIPAVVLELGFLMPYGMRKLGLSYRRLWTQAVLPQIPPLAALALYSWFVAEQSWSHQGWPALIAISIGGGAVLGSAWLVVRKVSERWD